MDGIETAIPVIAVHDVSFSYGEVPVLEGVNVTVEEGQFLCMIGPNGGGKTTLLRLLLGLLKPDTGEIQVLGKAPEEACRRVGYVPQHTLFDPQFPVTVMDVVLMGRLRGQLGLYSKLDRQMAYQSLQEVGLADLERRHFSALSGGQRQRVLIARALTGDPEILLLDEPTANVDVVAESQLNEILQVLNRRMTILLATHDVGFVSEAVKGVLCVNRRVVYHPTGEINGRIIRETYGTQMRVVRHDLFCGEEERIDG